jgi:SHS2 domain-containing protein
MDERYEEIEHTADLAIKAYGRDIKELFANAAWGMGQLMANLEEVEPQAQRQIHLTATDYEALLVDWLNELLYLHEMEGEFYIAYEIESLSPTELRATVQGGKVSKVKAEIKAATFHDLEIRGTGRGFETTIVFDV